VVLCVLLLGEWATPSATEQDQELPTESAGNLHEPLTDQSCNECHEKSVPLNGRCLLAKDQMCVLCHKIPEEGGKAELVDPSEALCFKCHAEEEFKGDFVHGPFAAGACLTCHSPHGADDSAMVRIEGRQMCLTCHEDMEASLASARFRHRAMASGCTDCHSPHASDLRYQLTKPVPDICAGCHEDIFDIMEAVVTHSPVKEDSACMNCHNPHMAENDQLLPEEDMDVCLGCHNEPIKTDRYELAPMGPVLAAKPRHHGPIQFRICSECHNPHGSKYFRLLTDAYPARLYSPFFESNYALCFRCHEPKLVEVERTDSATGFRDGDRNLHFVHVDKTSMGRTCRLCHDAHASSQPKQMRESVPFGKWDLPIKFKKTENGGSCEPGCHAAQSYDRLAQQSGRP
jgi:predicted CXXCH cytochrome family protein